MIGSSWPTVIGVDPGRVTGIAVLDPHEPRCALLQVTPEAVAHVIRSFSFGQVLAVAVEAYVIGPRSTRSSDAAAGRITRELVEEVRGLSAELDAPVLVRSAAGVKSWATDKRLAAAGVSARGMPHALDAGRHALFAAVHDFGFPDPLSSRPTRSPR